MVVRASDDVGFCRDKVAVDITESTGKVEGESTLVFLGAGGQQHEVQAPKVS